MSKHSTDDIVAAFTRVDDGLITNVHFSDADVVMCSKEHYAALADPAGSVETWRAMAKRFDAQRMAAMWHLKALLADPTGHANAARRFLVAGPAEQIDSVAPPVM